jgi:aromatic-L-amino-acid decarboxylase
MELDAFRREAHRLVDRMADYLRDLESLPVRSPSAPGSLAAALPAAAPEQSEPFDAIMADTERLILPGLTHWQHPRFFAYFPANSSPPAVLAEMLTATFAAQCMLWQTSPTATELETRVLDWLRRLCGLPDGFHGVIQDTASSATLCAVLTAREKATGWRCDVEGLGSCPPLAVYTTAEAHSSVEKAVRIAGLGRRSLRAIAVDDAWRMRPDALEAAILADRAAGIVPACVVASFGTTAVGALDPVGAIADLCRRHGLYLHVDAAWAGSALLLPEVQALAEGLGEADSIALNPHKWLLTNFDCTAHWVRDPEALTRTLTVARPYFQSAETGQVIDYRDWGVPLGRRFRALKLWFVLRSYGAEGLRTKLRRDIAMAEDFASAVAAEPDFELVTRSLALVVFRHRPPGLAVADLDAHNRALVERINADGRTYLTLGAFDGHAAIRLATGGTWTEPRHVAEAWDVIRVLARG